MNTKAKTLFTIALCSMFCFIGIHTLELFEVFEPDPALNLLAIGSFILYLPTSTLFLQSVLFQQKREKQVITDKMTALNVSNMIVVYDETGKVIKANSNFCENIKCCEDEIIGKYYYDLCDTKDIELWKVLLDGKHLKADFQKVFTKDNSMFFISGTYSPIKNTNGKIYQVIHISTDVTDDYVTKAELIENNAYLEHAAKILRHDMHSGINTYIPRGVSSLERRLDKMTALHRKSLHLDMPLKLIKEGLAHSQKVYRGVTEFTNLVRKDVEIEKKEFDLKAILKDYLSKTSYADQVRVDDLVTTDVNDALFCTAIDNLIRNGLKYNDSPTKIVIVTMADDNHIAVMDNGRGMKQKDFENLSKPYQRKPNQKEKGTGLGLNICVAILKEHNFTVCVDDTYDQGTCILIGINND